MYIDKSTSKDKYVRYLLRENYRENGKVKHRTIANLSKCSANEIEAIKLALKHKNDLTTLRSISNSVSLKQGLSVGGVWLVYQIAKQIGIVSSLGSTREGKLALWQVIARVIDQGSRLSAVRLASSHACCDILNMESFNEDDLYSNLDWLNENQAKIEDRLYKKLYCGKEEPRLFLYDVTSSYLEGKSNQLSAFGYNRDRKKGKKQIVIGLLCNEEGVPLTIEVFKGNTQDPKTISNQIKKVVQRFGGKEVIFVGDRGMIKNKQIEEIKAEGFHYITAITKPQIEKLLSEKVLQMSLFDKELAEVETEEELRYVLRRNPVRAEEIRKTRGEKLARIEKEIEKQNEYLKIHLRAKEEVAVRKIKELCKKLKITDWVKIKITERVITIEMDEAKLKEAEKLDGCYVLKTDITKEQVSKETIESRYKDLSKVEWAFRTSKTVNLEMRPIHVVLESRTRGHAFVVMLAYRIIQELSKRWRSVDLTIEEGIEELTTLCAIEVKIDDKPAYNKIPEPRESIAKLLKKAGVDLPEVLQSKGIKVATRKKLLQRRLTR